jgi:peptide-methionine (S)-S-oxide reductase
MLRRLMGSPRGAASTALVGAVVLGVALAALTAGCGAGDVSVPGGGWPDGGGTSAQQEGSASPPSGSQAAGGAETLAGGSCTVPGMIESASPPGAPTGGRTEIATFAAGCFWGVEARFAAIPGVVDAIVGYTGGTTSEPTYEEVCSHSTGHAEAVRVEYDPDVVSYQKLTERFFAMHDPTTEDRQGPDHGSQYRSAVFFHTPEQEATARAVMERLQRSGAYERAIVTEITPAAAFWRAEDYHQDYVERLNSPQ